MPERNCHFSIKALAASFVLLGFSWGCSEEDRPKAKTGSSLHASQESSENAASVTTDPEVITDAITKKTYTLGIRDTSVNIDARARPLLDTGDPSYIEPYFYVSPTLTAAWAGDAKVLDPQLVTDIATNERHVTVKSLSGMIDFNTGATGDEKACTNLVHADVPFTVVLLQFVNSGGKVVKTMQNGVSRGYLVAASTEAASGINLPADTAKVYASIPDVRYTDNNGSCALVLRLRQNIIHLEKTLSTSSTVTVTLDGKEIFSPDWVLSSDGKSLTIQSSLLTADSHKVEVTAQ